MMQKSREWSKRRRSKSNILIGQRGKKLSQSHNADDERNSYSQSHVKLM